jgi:precorrin-6B methylase 2
MQGLIGRGYRSIIPESIRRQLSLYFKNDDINKLRKEILHFYKRLPDRYISDEQREVISYLKKNPLSIFPYSFAEKYDYRDVKVFLDTILDLRYVIVEGNRLYFKRSWPEELIKGCYSFLQMEQDMESPHRYITNDFFVRNNDVVVDIGAAEGTFALSIVKRSGKIYLFESDMEWIEPLEATFAPWKSKVEIINRFVSDKNDEKSITLDYYFDNKEEIDFLKVDVEGTETEFLKGCEKVLSGNKSLKLAICTYHKQNDESTISGSLKNVGFEVSYSKGYMIYIKDKELRPPYFRRGLIRAQK